MDFFAKDIRNIALIGHSNEGKTTVAEAILFNCKAIDRMGSTTAGNTVMDFDNEEIARKISVSLAMASAVWKDVKLNIIDVPGFFDFEGEMAEALSACDSAVIIMGASGVLTVGAEKAINYCLGKKIPMMIFINQMDKENADYVATVEALKAKYTNKIAPIQIPIMDKANKMQGYISLMSGNSYNFSTTGREVIPMPKEYEGDYNALKEKLIDVAASNDEELMNKFFEGQPISQDEIVTGVRKGIAAGDAIPVLAGSALQNKGIINLIVQMTRIMPAPEVSNEKLFSCQVFKTIADPFVGRLSLFKVKSGSIKSGTVLNNVSQDKTEKISGVFTMKGKKQENAETLYAGDIGAFAKLTNCATGDTLCDPAFKTAYPAIEFPKPNISLCITSKNQGEEDKVFAGLYRLREEDPSFNIIKNSETAETLIAGMGEVQLDVICKKLKSKFNVEAVLQSPKIPYRETIKKTVTADGKHKKQSGGHGQYGHCVVKFEPLYDKDFEFAEEVVGGSVPKQYIPAVEKGLLECIPHGVLAKYPVVNLKCTLLDGSYHDVDSSEMAFKLAASLAYNKGMAEANPVLLEPIMSVEISVPDNYMGEIMGDLNRRRGRILGMDSDGKGGQIIKAEAPMAEMFRYSTDLRSMTQGRGGFNMELNRYEEVPPMLSGGIIAKAKADNA